MKKLIAGNWKMNGNIESAKSLAAAIDKGLKSSPDLLKTCDFAIFPPFIHIQAVQEELESSEISIGAQDCSSQSDGAYTGEVSAAMIKDTNCTYVILGHSERRQYHNETNALISSKASITHAYGLITIICVGETAGERDQGLAEQIVTQQLSASLPRDSNSDNTIIAYEPVWAIGTGKTATPGDVKAMHALIREKLKENLADSQKMRILYGGSMKPENARALLTTPNVDGGLIGGASLDADKFLAIGLTAPETCDK